MDNINVRENTFQVKLGTFLSMADTFEIKLHIFKFKRSVPQVKLVALQHSWNSLLSKENFYNFLCRFSIYLAQ